MNKRIRTYFLIAIAAALSAVSCRVGETIGLFPTPTPTVTATPTTTATPTSTATPTLTPTVTPVPLTPGSWSGKADGWDPPLTISFSVVAEDGVYRVAKLRLYIPNIDLFRFMTTLSRTTCTVQVDSLAIVDNGFAFPDSPGQRRAFDGHFGGAATATGSIYDGWSCDGKTVNLGTGPTPDGSTVTWHAEAAK